MKKNNMNKTMKYKGIGFVEALIALMVSGVVAIVLMSISANALQELHTIDTEDAIAQVAVSTAVQLQYLANQEAQGEPDDNVFYDLTPNQCYGFSSPDEGLVESPICSYNTDTGDISANCRGISGTTYGEGFYRIMCVLNSDSDSNKRRLVVKIFSGVVNLPGKATTDADVKDYEYYAVISL
jgi:hypothetical protein